jgi:hypothetical protein
MSEIQSEIQDDRLIRFVPLYSEGNCIAGQTTVVITKEEFLACYNEWVLKPMQENPVSVQSEFYVPVDDDGGTPV